MRPDLPSLLAPAVMERVTLLLNHVLGSEPAAAARLRAHSGRCMRVQFAGWPSLLPAWPVLAFRVTPAALLEWCGTDTPAVIDLDVAIDASNPALALLQALGGERPRIDVTGDAAFAADVSWLFDNLRWDVQDDLARIVGQANAHEAARLGTAVAGAVRGAARTLGELAQRARGGAAGQPGR
jgi:ubiquinone biosynthesis accessory factor UbiJ